MEINLTLVVQMVVFLSFVWFTMRFVWPPLVKALEERQAKIAEGLADAERGHRELELAKQRIKDELKQAKTQAADILEKANRRATQIIDEAKQEARYEAQNITKMTHEHLAQEVQRAKDTLRKQVGLLAVAGAEKILAREIDENTSHMLLNNLIEEI